MLDVKRKDKRKAGDAKWFSGEKWRSLVRGHHGSPGGAKVIASLAKIMADDNASDSALMTGIEERRSELEAAEREAAAARPAAARNTPAHATLQPPTGRGRGGGRGGRGRGALANNFTGLSGGTPAQARSSTMQAPARAPVPAIPPAIAPAAAEPHPDVAASKLRNEEGRRARLRELAMQQRVTTEMERQADPADLERVRKRYGNHAQMIITLLLTFDAYFACFWVGHKRIGFKCEMSKRELHALELCRAGASLFPSLCSGSLLSHECPTLSGVDLQEMMERVTMSNSKSWYTHLFYMRTPLVILEVGCMHAVCIGALEMLNAEVKRAAASNASKRVELKSADETVGHIVELRVKEGPARRVFAKPPTTTMSYQTASFIIARQRSRWDPEAIKHRRAERLFGEKGEGRLTKTNLYRLPAIAEEKGWDAVLATYVSTGYVDSSSVAPEHDTCLRAFCRLLQLEEEAGEVIAAV